MSLDFFNSDTKKYCQFYSADCFIFITEKSFYKAEQISSPKEHKAEQRKYSCLKCSLEIQTVCFGWKLLIHSGSCIGFHYIICLRKFCCKSIRTTSPDQMFQDQWNSSAPDIPSAGQCLFVTFPYCCHIPFRERSLSTDRAVDSTVSPPYTSKGMASIKNNKKLPRFLLFLSIVNPVGVVVSGLFYCNSYSGFFAAGPDFNDSGSLLSGCNCTSVIYCCDIFVRRTVNYFLSA